MELVEKLQREWKAAASAGKVEEMDRIAKLIWNARTSTARVRAATTKTRILLSDVERPAER